jgi:hypothetical protein
MVLIDENGRSMLALTVFSESIRITTKVVSSNPVHGELYSICDKVYQWLATGQWFSPGTPVSSTQLPSNHDHDAPYTIIENVVMLNN